MQKPNNLTRKKGIQKKRRKKKEENNLQNKICSPFSLLYQHPLCINMISLFFKS